ncbi:MAG: glycolate oxidase subunit GlcE [Acetobacteraceae bacterium]|jgi:glycolate oxidase FAD binding subunit
MTPTEAEAAIAGQIAAARDPLLIRGAGTKFGMLRPVQAAGMISTAGLTGITLYAPKELIISARAGTPLHEIEAILAAHGQHLIAEPPDLSALLASPPNTQTLGGVVATNLSGPRRVAWGAMRDHVMGVRAVTGRGEVIHSGGRVLKNVTGLDLCKLLTGSHGTLGVMTEITLKVLPAPEAVGTIVIPGLEAEKAVAALSAALGSPYGVSGAAFLPAEAASWLPDRIAPGRSLTLVRIEDFAASVAYRSAKLMAELDLFGAVILDDAASRKLWARVRDVRLLPVMNGEGIWRISVRPSSGPGVLRSVPGAVGYLDWGGGMVWFAGAPTETTHRAIEAAARAAGGTWTLMRAPDALRSAVNVVPPEAAPLAAITRRVKRAMDPRGILNPGRIYSGL